MIKGFLPTGWPGPNRCNPRSGFSNGINGNQEGDLGETLIPHRRILGIPENAEALLALPDRVIAPPFQRFHCFCREQRDRSVHLCAVLERAFGKRKEHADGKAARRKRGGAGGGAARRGLAEGERVGW